jgi:hypothetical protein
MESVECPRLHAAILMAGDNPSQPPVDPFSTPILMNTSPEDLDNLHKNLAAAREKELEMRQKFHLEQ